MTLDVNSFVYSLKQIYTTDKVYNMVYKDNPLLALLPKYEQFGGEVLPIPVVYSNPMGRSASFSNAVSNQTDSKGVKFLLSRVSDYAVAQFSNEVMLASQGNSYAFLEAAKLQMDGAIQALSNAHALDIYRSGSGSRGRIASGETTATITLSNTEDIVNFEVGMTLVASTADGGGSVKSGTAVITGLDRNAGTVTFGAALNTYIASIAANDYLFVQGDYDAKCKGLGAWIPASAPLHFSLS